MSDTTADILYTLNRVHNGLPLEIRAIGVPMPNGRRAVWSGYFDDYELAAAAAIECEDAGAEGVYMTIGRIHPGLMARSPNRLEKHNPKSTSNDDVLGPQWALIDIDPVRPSGVSSTDAELAAAIAVRDEIAATFEGVDVIRACSGNGAHLLIGPCVFREWHELVDLEQIAMAYSDERVKVDPAADSIRKPGQIVRLYGTVARKGFEYKDRRWRRSFIERVSGE